MREKGKLFIDGRDALLDYGLFVEDEGMKALIQIPSFKTLDCTEWNEYNGGEVDLSEPVLDTRTFSLQFCITNVDYAEELFYDLSNGAYHSFEFKYLKKTYKLRMTSNGSFSQFIRLGKLTLSFSDDFPSVPTAEPYTYGKTNIRQSGYEIDTIDFSQFGIYILNGSDANIRKAPNIRQNLTINTKKLTGAIYDDAEVYFKTKDVTFKLLINTISIDEFWKRWNALWAAVLKPETRTFYFNAMAKEFECYYKSNSVSKLKILRNGHVWCEFNLVLTFIDYYPDTSYMLLATEDGDLVITEETDEPARIKIRPKGHLVLLITEDGKYIVTEDNESKIYTNSNL